jgi:hypothetical protein
MEIFFAYSRILKKERDRQRQLPPVGQPIRRASSTSSQEVLPPDRRHFLLLATVCHTNER